MPRWLRSSATPQSRVGSDVDVDQAMFEARCKQAQRCANSSIIGSMRPTMTELR